MGEGGAFGEAALDVEEAGVGVADEGGFFGAAGSEGVGAGMWEGGVAVGEGGGD